MIQVSPPPPPADDPRPSSRLTPLAGGLACSALVLTAVLGIATLLGSRVREAALIADPSAEPAATLRYTDAPHSASFFDERDSVSVRVPWDMTVSEFLSLYHLENNADARAALERQLGMSRPEDLLKEGDQVAFRLTATRGTK
ncbi:MAG: hypothetical protein ACREMQ_20505 [Longimicrobiales bacterium]